MQFTENYHEIFSKINKNAKLKLNIYSVVLKSKKKRRSEKESLMKRQSVMNPSEEMQR